MQLKIKEELERKILVKEEYIKKLNLEIEGLIQNAKTLTFEEYAIADILIMLGTKIKRKEESISKLQYEQYELMQLLKIEN